MSSSPSYSVSDTQSTAVEKKDEREQEEILTDDDKRYVLFPLKYPDMYEMYKTHLSAFWVLEEIDMANDRLAFEKLDKNTQNFIAYVLAFFSQADCLVIENINDNFADEVKPLEGRMFYCMQNLAESIHAETYAQLLQTIVVDPDERHKLIHSVHTFKCIGAKHKWVEKYMNRDIGFARRLLAFIILEGLFFSAAFCAIYYLKKKGVDMDGLITSNEFISRDEGLHTNFGVLLYKKYLPKTRLSQEDVVDMFKEAVEIERDCCIEALPVRLIGMNAELMHQYVQFVADGLLFSLGYDKIYGTANPFNFMVHISCQVKTNFFENVVSSYRKAGVGDKKEDNVFSLDVDF